MLYKYKPKQKGVLMNTILNQIKSVDLISSIDVLDCSDTELESLLYCDKGSFYLYSYISDNNKIEISLDVDDSENDDMYQVYHKSYDTSDDIAQDLKTFFSNL